MLQNQAKDEELSFTERAMLLGLAVKWFSDSSLGQQWKTSAELKELQKNRWLFKIRAEIEKDDEVRRMIFYFQNMTPRKVTWNVIGYKCIFRLSE